MTPSQEATVNRLLASPPPSIPTHFCPGERGQLLSEMHCPHLPGLRGLERPVRGKKPPVNGGGVGEEDRQLQRAVKVLHPAEEVSKVPEYCCWGWGWRAGRGGGHRSRTLIRLNLPFPSPSPPFSGTFLPLPSIPLLPGLFSLNTSPCIFPGDKSFNPNK